MALCLAGCEVVFDLEAPSHDEDLDGVPDGQDNCPTVSNEDQVDDESEPDAVGDVCDPHPILGGDDVAFFADGTKIVDADFVTSQVTSDGERFVIAAGGSLATRRTFGRSVSRIEVAIRFASPIETGDVVTLTALPINCELTAAPCTSGGMSCLMNDVGGNQPWSEPAAALVRLSFDREEGCLVESLTSMVVAPTTSPDDSPLVIGASGGAVVESIIVYDVP
ncbi:MAG: thrombospondin type 3 repeat-containing protein [Deltaproteobacteria bacterium]|nr:thrombospondin type 3 repeat-containing protein [Deltaproteobacteria bacterium]